MTDAAPQPPILTPELVCRIGFAIFGREWQAPLARLLGVNARTVRHVAAAAGRGTDYRVNQDWLPRLLPHLRPVARDYELRGRDAEALLRLFEGRPD